MRVPECQKFCVYVVVVVALALAFASKSSGEVQIQYDFSLKGFNVRNTKRMTFEVKMFHNALVVGSKDYG